MVDGILAVLVIYGNVLINTIIISQPGQSGVDRGI
jgi:hypothetical protein